MSYYLEDKQSYSRLLAADGTAITETAGALDVNVASGSISVDISANTDTIQVYGQELVIGPGVTLKPLVTDAYGRVMVGPVLDPSDPNSLLQADVSGIVELRNAAFQGDRLKVDSSGAVNVRELTGATITNSRLLVDSSGIVDIRNAAFQGDRLKVDSSGAFDLRGAEYTSENRLKMDASGQVQIVGLTSQDSRLLCDVSGIVSVRELSSAAFQGDRLKVDNSGAVNVRELVGATITDSRLLVDASGTVDIRGFSALVNGDRLKTDCSGAVNVRELSSLEYDIDGHVKVNTAFPYYNTTLLDNDALTANTLTSTAAELHANPAGNKVMLSGYVDQSGVITLHQSPDGTTYYPYDVQYTLATDGSFSTYFGDLPCWSLKVAFSENLTGSTFRVFSKP